MSHNYPFFGYSLRASDQSFKYDSLSRASAGIEIGLSLPSITIPTNPP